MQGMPKTSSFIQLVHEFLAQMVMDNRLAIVYLLAREGGVCAIQDTSFCVHMNNSGQVQAKL